jgi:hypothetical protein
MEADLSSWRYVEYTIEEHRHRFAVWAAARASQRGFRNVADLREALEATDIRSFLARRGSLDISEMEFKERHRQWCKTICDRLSGRSPIGVTFGRAAKLVAVYLKTIVIMGEHWDSSLGRNAHPPIDRRLLKALMSKEADKSIRRSWGAVSWTKLDEDGYYRLVHQLRTTFAPSQFWTLERYWQPSDIEE